MKTKLALGRRSELSNRKGDSVMIKFKQTGDFSKSIQYMGQLKKGVNTQTLSKYAEECVSALSSATPVNTGLTANSWYYKIENKGGSANINFYNSNIQNGVPIAIIIQYGHGTRNGGWVQGRDYINPAVRPIFDRIAVEAWKEVTKL